jgi:hypothetical protein
MSTSDLPNFSRQMIDENISLMRAPSPQNFGMDVIIVVTSNKDQEIFWEKRLEQTIGFLGNKDALIICTSEDWPGGAGNGLGTLYAFLKASVKAQKKKGVDLLELLRDGASIAMYHTAGKGTRLAPLPGSECNNKPSVKLPEILPLKDSPKVITILEAVIRQTGIYASSRKGRLSVFWGDQIFIPSVKAEYEALHHIDILMRNLPKPSRKDWESRGLSNYGLILSDSSGNATQVEKVDFDAYQSLLEENQGQNGMSLGCFSLSYEITKAFLKEFSSELETKLGFFNSDQDFWMPLTLDFEIYSKLLGKKGGSSEKIQAHYERMQSFKKSFLAQNPKSQLFSAVELGENCYVWDYGQIFCYYENTLSLTGTSHEAEAMRKFFSLKKTDENGNILLNCQIQKGEIHNSVLIGVSAEVVNVTKAVIINTSAKSIEGEHFLAYNVLEKEKLALISGSVRADAFVSEDPKHLTFKKEMKSNGEDDWNVRLEGNPLSFQELYECNEQTSLVDAERSFQ